MKNITRELSMVLHISFIVVLSAVFMVIPDLAFAAYSTMGVSNVPSGLGLALCATAGAFTGEVASGMATIGICVIGALATLGRVQWTSAVIVATGIAILFGAADLVNVVGAGFTNNPGGCT